MENSSDAVFGFTAGAGINYKAGDLAIVFDYAYQDVQDFPTSNHIFNVKSAFE